MARDMLLYDLASEVRRIVGGTDPLSGLGCKPRGRPVTPEESEWIRELLRCADERIVEEWEMADAGGEEPVDRIARRHDQMDHGADLTMSELEGFC